MLFKIKENNKPKMALSFFVEVTIRISMSLSTWQFVLPSIGVILANVYLDIHVTVYSGISANKCTDVRASEYMGIHAKVTTITC